VELSASLIHGDDQEVTTVGFFRDLRERRQLQEKLLQSERLAALGQMAAHISHEVKNPLVVIGGLAGQVLKASQGDSPKSVEKLRIMPGNSRLGGIFGRGEASPSYRSPESAPLISTP
jgi:signal transduction histidine kinase